jgi:hypothetical protein
MYLKQEEEAEIRKKLADADCPEPKIEDYITLIRKIMEEDNLPLSRVLLMVSGGDEDFRSLLEKNGLMRKLTRTIFK